MKDVSYSEAEAKRRKAEQFLRDVVGDDDRADEFGAMSTETYAARKGLRIINPARRTTTMAYTKAQLEERIRDLEEENETLAEQIDEAAKIFGFVDDEDEDDDSEDDDDDDEGDDEGN